MLASLLLLGFSFTVAAALLHLRTARELTQLRIHLRQADAWLREREQIATQIRQLKELQLIAENTVAAGTEIAKALHQGISAIPFGILETIPMTRDTTKVVRAVHDQISKLVFDVIAGTNRSVGSVLRQGLGSDTPASKQASTKALPNPDKSNDDQERS